MPINIQKLSILYLTHHQLYKSILLVILSRMLVIIKPGFIENQLFGKIFTVLESSCVINRFKMFLFT